MFDWHISYRAHTVPLPCSDHALCKRFLKAKHQHGMCTVWARRGIWKLTSTVSRRPVGNLPRFGFFRLPHGVLRLVFRIFLTTRGLSRRARLCRRLCMWISATRHDRGTAGERRGTCEFDFWGSFREVVEITLRMISNSYRVCGFVWRILPFKLPTNKIRKVSKLKNMGGPKAAPNYAVIETLFRRF